MGKGNCGLSRERVGSLFLCWIDFKAFAAVRKPLGASMRKCIARTEDLSLLFFVRAPCWADFFLGDNSLAFENRIEFVGFEIF
jgi:hypothetical protein